MAGGKRGARPRGGTRPTASVARWHRRLGILLTLPLLAWVASATGMWLVTLDLPGGLAGVYDLQPYDPVDLPLDEPEILPPARIQEALETEGVERLYWLRLETWGDRPLYLAKPTPFALALAFDAHTGERLDPLPPDLLRVRADAELLGTRVGDLQVIEEPNRYYTVDRVPAVLAVMEGDQPTHLVLSRDEGRTLRRSDADARRFTWWYHNFHVLQWTNHLPAWTTVLYLLAAATVALGVLGVLLFLWRRGPSAKRPGRRPRGARSRRWHRILGVSVGVLLILQILVGSYLWLNLGPLEDPFRGKGSFNTEWVGGFSTGATLTPPAEVLERVRPELPALERPVQAVEWRWLDGREAWIVSPRGDQAGITFDGESGARIEALPPETVGRIVREEVVGRPDFEYRGEARELWIDLNDRVPTYRFRFEDPWSTDVHADPATAQVIQRRPGIWRAFSPFLRFHMLAVTGNKVVDGALLGLFQLGILILLVTGWRLQWIRWW